MGSSNQLEEGVSNEASNVVSFVRPSERQPEPPFTSEERAEIRRVLRQFAKLRAACPTARRESGD